MSIRIFEFLTIALCLTPFGCTDSPDVSRKRLDLRLTYSEFNPIALGASIDTGDTYFLLFLPYNHPLTTGVSNQIAGYTQERPLDLSYTQVIVVRYQFGQMSDSLVELNGLLPDTAIPKDPYLMMMTGSNVAAKHWLTDKKPISDVVEQQIRGRAITW